jgi:hypothetical protein
MKHRCLALVIKIKDINAQARDLRWQYSKMFDWIYITTEDKYLDQINGLFLKTGILESNNTTIYPTGRHEHNYRIMNEDQLWPALKKLSSILFQWNIRFYDTRMYLDLI